MAGVRVAVYKSRLRKKNIPGHINEYGGCFSGWDDREFYIFINTGVGQQYEEEGNDLA